MIEMGYKDNFQFPISNFQTNSKYEIRNTKYENGLLEKKPSLEGIKQKPVPDYLPEHFSFSQLAAFDKCPLQYKFAFILKVPTRGKAVFSFGKTMHHTFYNFLKYANESKASNQRNLFGFEEKNAEPSFAPSFAPASAEATAGKKATDDKKASEGLVNFDYLVKIYEKNWIDEWYENKKQKEEYYKLGRKIIKDFYKEFSKNPPKVLKINNTFALEMPFNLKIGGHTLYGVIDRIDEKEGEVVIIDYKTGNSKDKLSLDDKEQLLIYQIAAEEIFKIKPKKLIYHYLNDGKKASFLGSEKEKERLKEKIIQEIEEMKKSDFKPTPGWQCAFCDFKDICDFRQR